MGYFAPVRVCLLVAVGCGGCWLVIAAAIAATAVGVILGGCLIRGTRRVPY